MRSSLNYSTPECGRSSRVSWPNYESEFDFGFGEVGNVPARTAKQIFASQTKVREAVDANFWSIFADRNKVVVVAFWADSCQSCAEAATAITTAAQRLSKGLSGPVKFYHVQWDPRVNPRIHRTFGFQSAPVVFFYYTSTGRPPSRTAPLLEGSFGHDDKHDAERYVRNIEAILRRHATASVLTSQRRGWTKSRDLIGQSDFADIDKILIEPSPFKQYFDQQYSANPGIRFSKRSAIKVKSAYDAIYQKINGSIPGGDDAGTVDMSTRQAFLLAVDRHLHTYLSRAIHEAIHMFTCPITGPKTTFYVQYGSAITEGFTQYITEEILKSQRVTIVSPPYQAEVETVKKLIRVVGVQALADDYFLCTPRVFENLNRKIQYNQFFQLRRVVDQQRAKGSEREKREAYKKLNDFLDSIPK